MLRTAYLCHTELVVTFVTSLCYGYEGKARLLGDKDDQHREARGTRREAQRRGREGRKSRCHVKVSGTCGHR